MIAACHIYCYLYSGDCYLYSDYRATCKAVIAAARISPACLESPLRLKPPWRACRIDNANVKTELGISDNLSVPNGAGALVQKVKNMAC